MCLPWQLLALPPSLPSAKIPFHFLPPLLVGRVRPSEQPFSSSPLRPKRPTDDHPWLAPLSSTSFSPLLLLVSPFLQSLEGEEWTDTREGEGPKKETLFSSSSSFPKLATWFVVVVVAAAIRACKNASSSSSSSFCHSGEVP